MIAIYLRVDLLPGAAVQSNNLACRAPIEENSTAIQRKDTPICPVQHLTSDHQTSPKRTPSPTFQRADDELGNSELLGGRPRNCRERERANQEEGLVKAWQEKQQKSSGMKTETYTEREQTIASPQTIVKEGVEQSYSSWQWALSHRLAPAVYRRKTPT